jgi:ribosomal protein L28
MQLVILMMKQESTMTGNCVRFFRDVRKRTFKLNLDKLKLRLKEVSYLGHRISAEGLKVDPKKI